MGLSSWLSSIFGGGKSDEGSAALMNGNAHAMPTRPAPVQPPRGVGAGERPGASGRIASANEDELWDTGVDMQPTRPAVPAGTPGVSGGALMEVLPTAMGAPKCSKQEMLEELERNYREIVDVVRKVGANPDQEQERALRMTRLGEQILEASRLVPAAIEQSTQKLLATQERLHEEQVKLHLEQMSAIGRHRGAGAFEDRLHAFDFFRHFQFLLP